ncbi:hypothetical protein Golomagni_06923, partial [Golovinomyces magnicellulatus]
WGIQHSQLPAPTAKGDELKSLLTSLFNEAFPFIQGIPSTTKPTTVWKPIGIKTFAASSAVVHLFSRTVPADELKAVASANESVNVDKDKIAQETWFLRQSVHKDAAELGTATWDEFVKSFKDEHAEAELSFTESIQSTHMFQEWDCSGVEIQVDDDTWTDWTLKYEESVHKLPPPLTKRVFPVLQATASAKGRKDVLIVQVYVDGGPTSPEAKEALRASYTSIERIRETGDGIEWTMGTVSNAKGNLPQWVQNMSIAGMVAKDVGMFLEWIPTQRKNTE